MESVIVVTGATNGVGRYLAEHLLSAGHAVRLVARKAEQLRSLGERGADVRTGDLSDRTFLSSVFDGAAAAFLLTPVNLFAQDVNAEQMKNIVSITDAIRDSDVKHVVLRSSWGAELTENSGGIMGCHIFEEMLDGISGLNVVHLRGVWFMENFLQSIPLIKMAGINGLAIKPGLSFPMIATRDIATIAADYLQDLRFKGRTIRYLNGPRDYAMTEVTRILGASVDMPHLKYVEFPEGVFRKGLLSGGLTPNAAELAIESNLNINSGRVKAEPRSKSNTTATTLEEFAKTTFAPAFKATPNASFTDRLAGAFLRSFLFVSGHRAA